MITAVKVEYTRKTVGSPESMARLWSRSGGSILFVLAKEIKKRVQGRGDVAGQRVPPYPSDKMRFVNPQYPISGGRITTGGLRGFKSSADMHRGVKRGSYDVTGGMWKGLSVVQGVKTAKLAFRSTSVGQAFRASERTSKKTGKKISMFFKGGKKKGLRKGIRPSNALKAGTVMRQHGVNVLALSNRELIAIGDGIVGAVRQRIAVGDAEIEWTGGRVRSSLERQIVRRLLS